MNTQIYVYSAMYVDMRIYMYFFVLPMCIHMYLYSCTDMNDRVQGAVIYLLL